MLEIIYVWYYSHISPVILLLIIEIEYKSFMHPDDEPFSEPLELFFHGPDGAKLANTAFDIASKLYNLQSEKYVKDDYCIGYFRLLDPESQNSRKDILFKQGTDLIRRLVGYKSKSISEPRTETKVKMQDLKAALQALSVS